MMRSQRRAGAVWLQARWYHGHIQPALRDDLRAGFLFWHLTFEHLSIREKGRIHDRGRTTAVIPHLLAERGHAIIPSAPLVPENDPTVLFTTAGMHPLVPYLLGETHPKGRRLVDVQKCLRTDDIEEVGDISHNTFFEMLGFWSLGDYWKGESLRWTLEWFTRVLGLEQERISVTVFAGDDDAPRDDEAAQVWLSLGIPQERIYYLPKKDNWWGPAGKTGPCGPDSELFYDTGRPKHGPDCQPGCDCGKYRSEEH